MTDDKSPREKLLDLLVFGPAGLAMTAVEEFPKLAEKGRHRVEGQVHTARLVGQFAVQMGRKQLEQTVGGFMGRKAVPARTSPSGSSPEPPAPPPPPPAVQPPPPPTTASAAPVGPPANGSVASMTLGIPGYDSLSASQVVQRLGGLKAAELVAVHAHELAHRHRRTILNRVEQLLAGAPSGG